MEVVAGKDMEDRMTKEGSAKTMAGSPSREAAEKEIMATGPAPAVTLQAYVAEHDEIARLAYSYWKARGCPDGSPEEDWLRAESDLQALASGLAA